MSEPDTADPSAILLDCRYNQRLASDMAAVHALLAAAQIALVDFNHSSQPLTAGPDHSAAKLMQTRPCRLITAPAEHTLQRYRAYTVLLTDQQPHGAKPYSQWRSRILKHRARGHRNLIAATGALNTARLQGPTLASFASRTMESVRPSEIKQIPPASLLRAEAPLKLQKRTGIILFHAHEHYRLGLPESNGYPVPHDTEGSEWCIATSHESTYVPAWNGDSDGADIWKDFAANGKLGNNDLVQSCQTPAGALCATVELDPGDSAT